MGEVDKIGRRTGMLLTFASVGVLTGPPISGAINARTGGYTKVGYYAGVSFATCLYRISDDPRWDHDFFDIHTHCCPVPPTGSSVRKDLDMVLINESGAEVEIILGLPASI